MAGKDAQVKEAASNLGKTAVTLTRTINNALLPLAVLNYGIEKAKHYFEERFQLDLAEKVKDIPSDELIEPKASLAGPTLQGLAFVHEDNDLKSMYLGLLATAMDARNSRRAHAAFVEIIKQIDPSEIGPLQVLLTAEGNQPVAEIRLYMPNANGGHRVLRRHYVDGFDSDAEFEDDFPGFPVMIDNWVRLGLVHVTYTRFLQDANAYKWIETSGFFTSQKEKLEREGATVGFERGLMGPTDFGRQFADAVGMRRNPTPIPNVAVADGAP